MAPRLEDSPDRTGKSGLARPVSSSLTAVVMGPGLRRDDTVFVARNLASHRRHQLVPARACIKLAAALALDGGAARGGGCVLRERDRAAQAVGAAARLAGGEGGAVRGDADDEEGGGGDFDQPSHQSFHRRVHGGASSTQMAELAAILAPNPRFPVCVRVPKSARSLHNFTPTQCTVAPAMVPVQRQDAYGQ